MAGAAVLVALVAWMVWAGGAPARLDHVQVRESLATIDSLRAEAHHLDRLVADGKDLPRTTAVRAQELATALDDESATLSTAQVPGRDRAKVRRAVAQASDTTDHLEELVAHPEGGSR